MCVSHPLTILNNFTIASLRTSFKTPTENNYFFSFIIICKGKRNKIFTFIYLKENESGIILKFVGLCTILILIFYKNTKRNINHCKIILSRADVASKE